MKPCLQAIPPTICGLEDYARLAVDYIEPSAYAYIAGGSGDEVTLNANPKAFDQVSIYSRPLRDVSQSSTVLSLLGKPFKHPIMLAPVAHQLLVHPDAECASIAAADAVDAGFIASTLSSVTLEEIASSSVQRPWFQLYFQAQREHTLALLERAEAAGYSAIVVTVDTPITALRKREQRAGFMMPKHVVAANLLAMPAPTLKPIAAHESRVFQGVMSTAPSWHDLQWLQQQTQLPVVIKGLLHADDVLQAQQLGFAGVVVSNHGGRALDGVPASLTAIAAIRARVGADFPLLLDGGIRRGSDVFKALALGANAVLVGRPQLYALAVAGALGVAHMLRTLIDEFEVTMALAGCNSLAELNQQCIVDRG